MISLFMQLIMYFPQRVISTYLTGELSAVGIGLHVRLILTHRLTNQISGLSLLTTKRNGANSRTLFKNVTMRCSVYIVTVTMRYFLEIVTVTISYFLNVVTVTMRYSLNIVTVTTGCPKKNGDLEI